MTHINFMLRNEKLYVENVWKGKTLYSISECNTKDNHCLFAEVLFYFGTYGYVKSSDVFENRVLKLDKQFLSRCRDVCQ